jgi:NAD dependent epimerase/dehydratase family enzyme
MRILVMGGTRFIGVYLTRLLTAQEHDVVLFNRGNRPAPLGIEKQIQGDRTDPAQLKEKLADEEFDAIFDNNGRELADTQPLVELFKLTQSTPTVATRASLPLKPIYANRICPSRRFARSISMDHKTTMT